MTKEITTKKDTTIKNYDVQKIQDMTAMANVLKSYVVKNNLYTTISNKNYVHVEGWQFAGGMMNTFPRIVSVERIEANLWKAEAEIVNSKTGEIISRGFAICSNKETKKKSFDEYAILSMAQTRAIGKAYRNVVGWVMKLAGYEGTPSEEMRKVDETPKDPTNQQSIVPPVAIVNYETNEVKGQTKPEVCQSCDAIVTPQEAQYSKRMFKKQLCRDCQKEAKAKK